MEEPVVEDALRARLDAVDREIADLQGLLDLVARLERDAALRERVGRAELPFAWDDLRAGSLTGPRLRRALEALDGLATA